MEERIARGTGHLGLGQESTVLDGLRRKLHKPVVVHTDRLDNIGFPLLGLVDKSSIGIKRSIALSHRVVRAEGG